MKHQHGAALYAAAASYDIDGQPDNAEVGPGLRLTERSDAAGNTTTRRYESDAGARLAAWTSLPNTAGQTRDLQRNGTQGAAAGQAVTDRRQTFTYDHADRLVRADDQTTAPDGASTCTMRDYTYRPDGARTASTSGTAAAMPDSDLAATCSGSVTQTAARTHSVNAWAQITATTLTGANPGSGNYTYDPLGRVVGLPAVDSPAGTPADTALGHFADGLPHTTTINGSTRTWARDPAGRLAAWTDTIPGQPDTSGTNHYDDPTGDSPAWTRNNDGTTTTWLTGPDGTLATSLTIAADDTLTGQGVLIDPLGATTATLALAADPADTTWTPETLQPAADIDEYGVTLPGATTSTLTGGPGNTLGWHAQNQRPTNTTTGLVALGVRQYNPATGQFLSPDPIPGGNTTPYTHPQDPINQTDLNGLLNWEGVRSWIGRNRGTLVTLGAAAGCAVPGVGWVACAGLQAAAFGIRTTQRASEGGGFRKQAKAIDADAAVTTLTFGLIRAPLYMARYAKVPRVYHRQPALTAGWRQYQSSPLQWQARAGAAAGASVSGAWWLTRKRRGW